VRGVRRGETPAETCAVYQRLLSVKKFAPEAKFFTLDVILAHP